MKLYTSIGPNPSLVKLFAAIKGLNLATTEVDILSGENREPAFLAKNPSGATPVLELPNGSFLSETTAICELLEELHPTPALIGESTIERAQTRMWWRRVDQAIVQPMTAGFRAAEGLAMFASRVACFPESAQALKDSAQDGYRWLEAQLAHPYICGPRLTVVDLLMYVFSQFGAQVGQAIPSDCPRLHTWLACLDHQLQELSQ